MCFLLYSWLFFHSMVDVSKWAKKNWVGKWIWLPGARARQFRLEQQRSIPIGIQPDEMNKFALFRKICKIDSPFSKAFINISVDSRYRLYINGIFIGRGIHRCEAYYWYYDTYDITEYLAQGENIIAIEGRFYGRELAFYNPPELSGSSESNSGKGGLIFEILLQNQKGEIIATFGSDEQTMVISDPSQNSNAPNKGGLGYTEIVDLSKRSPDWKKLNFDDSKWLPAKVYDYPILTLIKDRNQRLFEKEEYPSKILSVGVVNDCNVDFDEEEKRIIDFVIQNNLDGKLFPAPDSLIINAEGLKGTGVCQINPPGEGNAVSILLQYNSMMVGYPRLLLEGPKGTIVDIINAEKANGQSLSLEPMTDKRGARLILSGGIDSFEQWEYEGFLYQQIKIRNLTGPLKIHKISSLRISMLPEKLGKFECSDPDLTDLWASCAFTLMCCATDGYMDCPQREQRSYLGDAYVEALVSQVCFGTHKLTKKILYDAAFGQRKDGITFSYHPGDYEGSCHIIPDYCLYWIQLAEMYYQWSGETDVLIDLYPHFLRAIDWFMPYFDQKVGLLGNLPYWVFIDWAYDRDKGIYNAIVNAQFMDCLLIISRIAKLLGDHYHESKYIEMASLIKTKLNALCWIPELGCYQDSTDGVKPTGLISQHTNAYLSLKGVASKEQQEKILQTVFLEADPKLEDIQINKDRPKRVEKFPEDTNAQFILYAQPFFMHYIHAFLDIFEQHEIILRYFKKGWVPMIREGKTKTLWETWSNKQSECHAWSATPAYDLTTYWLGVRSASPQFREILIKPSLTGLKWAKGMVPTPMGDIHVKWQSSESNENHVIEFEITIPEEVQSTKFIIPKLDGKRFKSITLNRNEYIPIAHTVQLSKRKNILKIIY
jgi:alpha-L-rhamnosidase